MTTQKFFFAFWVKQIKTVFDNKKIYTNKLKIWKLESRIWVQTYGQFWLPSDNPLGNPNPPAFKEGWGSKFNGTTPGQS